MMLVNLIAGIALAAPSPSELSAQVDAERVDLVLQRLSGEVALPSGTVVRSRHIEHPHHAEVIDWLGSELEAIDGLVVSQEAVSRGNVRGTNLVASLPGLEPGLGWVVLGAHLDSTASFDEGYRPAEDDAPGADDDASGVAAVLEAARLLAGHGAYAHGLRFVFFDAEEQGLVGSTAYVQTLDEPTEVVWVLDPVGYNAGEDRLWVVGNALSLSEAEGVVQLAGDLDSSLDVVALDAALIGGDERSDHAPFWDDGRVALHLASFPQPPAYHTGDDRYSGVDLAFLVEVTRLVTARAAQVAEPREPVSCGCRSASGMGTSLGWGVGVLMLALRRRRL